MVRVRIDDVLTETSAAYDSPLARFAQISRWLEKSDRIKHVPTIIVKDIQTYAKSIDFIKEKVKEKKMFPELHGWVHVDYNKLGEAEIAEHLERSMEWFKTALGCSPTIWATPWGAESEKLSSVANKFGLIVEGTGNCIEPATWLREARNGKILDGVTVMDHWWARGLRLLRIAHILSYGSYKQAAENEDIF